jgi:hypothetical protein
MQTKERSTYSESYDRLDLWDTLQWVWDMTPKRFCLTEFSQYARMIEIYCRFGEEFYDV